MPVPDDAAALVYAMRLGWYVAEVRGRNRLDGPSEGIAEQRYSHPVLSEARRSSEPALLLRAELSAPELRVAAQEVLVALAGKLDIDANPEDGSSYSKQVAQQADELATLRDKGSDTAEQAWYALAQLIFKFDVHIQDSLTAKSETQASGYQLGRAVAESYWALNPSLSSERDDPAAWWVLLGPRRCQEIVNLVKRLSAYMAPDTPSAMAGSLQVWRHIATNAAWRTDAKAYLGLHRQVLLWYDLITTAQDPMTFVSPYMLARIPVRRLLRLYWRRVMLLVVGIAALIAFVSLLGSGTGGALVNVVLGIVAAVGVSIGGLGLSAGGLRQDMKGDTAAIAITTAPPRPPGSPAVTVIEPKHDADPTDWRKLRSRLVRERHLSLEQIEHSTDITN
jgi:hypothetical protein